MAKFVIAPLCGCRNGSRATRGISIAKGDLRPELTHYYTEEFASCVRPALDPDRWEPGKRIVFDMYSREMYEESFAWIATTSSPMGK